ncbi:hypothetical protein EON65_00740 [archaeon]|nr:MAG: hypothetical protein EON65_00740 [archaeon]
MPKKLHRFAPGSDKEEKVSENEKKTSISSKARKQSPNPIPLPTPTLSSSKRHYFQQYSHVSNVLSYLEQHVATNGYQLTSPPKVCDPSEKQMYDYHKTLAYTSDSGISDPHVDIDNSQKQKDLLSRPYSAPRRLLVKYKNQHALKRDNIIPSVEVKDILTTQHFPEYISLRESYLAQLKQIAAAVLDIEVENEKQSLKTRLLLLIQALRQLSVKMVRVYKQTVENDTSSQYELWDDFVDCLKSIPSTFDFIDSIPFRNYTGLYLTCNPFASLYDLLGEFAVNSLMLSHEALLRISHKPKYDDIVMRILPKALRFTEDEFDAHQEATMILRSICAQSAESSKEKGSGDAARQSALTFLLFQPTSMAALEERCAIVEKSAQRNNTQRSLGQWRMRYMIFQAVHSYAEQRTEQLVKKYFSKFVQLYHHRVGMKALLQNARKQELSKGMRKWKAVFHW